MKEKPPQKEGRRVESSGYKNKQDPDLIYSGGLFKKAFQKLIKNSNLNFYSSNNSGRLYV